jgi:IclR family acetate operon transcriptional repressor
MKGPESPSESGARSPTRVQSVQRAVRALLYVVEKPEGATGTEIAQELDLPTPTVFHLVNTLVDEGLLAKFERRYHLGPRVGVLADAFMRMHSPAPNLRAALQHLGQQTNETVYLTSWHHGEVVVLEAIEGTYALKVAGPHTGYQWNAHSRASGKCLLAALDDASLDAYFGSHSLTSLTAKTITQEADLREELVRVREQGYALEMEEFSVGIACLAMGITQDDVTLGAYSITAPVERLVAHQDEYLECLREAAAEVTQASSPP